MHATTPRSSAVFDRPGAPAGASVDALIDDFLAALDDGSARDRRGAPFTRRGARELHWWLGAHVRETLGPIDAGALFREDVEALVFALGDAGISDRHLRDLARSVRALYDFALARRVVSANPAERVALPDDATEPVGRPSARPGPPSPRVGTDRLIALGLRTGTLGFLVFALTLLVESL
jgi:hypothetical protein